MAVERKNSTEVKSLAENQAEEQIRFLKEQNAQLARLSGLLDDFVTERDRSLEDAFTKMKQENGRVESSLNGFTEEYSRKADEVVMRNQELSTSLEKKGEQCKRLRDGAYKVILGCLAFCTTINRLRSPSAVSATQSSKVCQVCRTLSQHPYQRTPRRLRDKLTR